MAKKTSRKSAKKEPTSDVAYGYVVRKTYAGGMLAYFSSENEFYFAWVPDKKNAHIFPSREEALVFAKRTEVAHAQRMNQRPPGAIAMKHPPRWLTKS